MTAQRFEEKILAKKQVFYLHACKYHDIFVLGSHTTTDHTEKQVNHMTQRTADAEHIRWLLDESGISRYKISNDIGMSESMLSRLARDEISIDSIRFGYASQLTAYAIQAKREREMSEGSNEA